MAGAYFLSNSLAQPTENALLTCNSNQEMAKYIIYGDMLAGSEQFLLPVSFN